eukprot:TRINITY_DN19018_c0_g1_i1.p2 TRINITY_DN19018_c0_g1~~TRINITY_DN19018_c0_g1_i1.p2  ORF type:complete len:137 (-),score=20.67 TRINITY_DN19018_c0_g1_i1:34-420(-)
MCIRDSSQLGGQTSAFAPVAMTLKSPAADNMQTSWILNEKSMNNNHTNTSTLNQNQRMNESRNDPHNRVPSLSMNYANNPNVNSSTLFGTIGSNAGNTPFNQAQTPNQAINNNSGCLLYTSPSPRDQA